MNVFLIYIPIWLYFFTGVRAQNKKGGSKAALCMCG